MSYDNVVLLIPGFLGFGRLGNFYYFADRVSACIRGAAENAFGTPTPLARKVRSLWLTVAFPTASDRETFAELVNGTGRFCRRRRQLLKLTL